MSDAIAGRYQMQRKKEGMKDSFMQGSRQISNAIQTSNGTILSDKFELIYKCIQENPLQLQLVYSNFVQNGCILFRDYCMQNQTSKYKLQEVVNENGKLVVRDDRGNKGTLQNRLPDVLRIALVHGEMN